MPLASSRRPASRSRLVLPTLLMPASSTPTLDLLSDRPPTRRPSSARRPTRRLPVTGVSRNVTKDSQMAGYEMVVVDGRGRRAGAGAPAAQGRLEGLQCKVVGAARVQSLFPRIASPKVTARAPCSPADVRPAVRMPLPHSHRMPCSAARSRPAGASTSLVPPLRRVWAGVPCRAAASGRTHDPHLTRPLLQAVKGARLAVPRCALRTPNSRTSVVQRVVALLSTPTPRLGDRLEVHRFLYTAHT